MVNNPASKQYRGWLHLRNKPDTTCPIHGGMCLDTAGLNLAPSATESGGRTRPAGKPLKVWVP